MKHDHIHQLCGGCAACPQCGPHESFCGRDRAARTVNFAGMGEDEDPDAYDRQRDLDLEDGFGWNAIYREVYR